MGSIVISGKKLLAFILKNGGILVRSRGSHHFVKFGTNTTIIPIHGKEDLPDGTVRKIMKDLGLTIEDIVKAKK